MNEVAISHVKRWTTDVYEGRSFAMCGERGCLKCSSVALALGEFDLSPLQKFMGRRIRLKNSTGRPVTIGDVTVAPNSEFDWVPPAPSPEKSPQDKALDDFIAKRKAKREVAKGWDVNSAGAPDPSYHKDMYHLDRAMRRLSFHEQDIHTRLMPYRREE